MPTLRTDPKKAILIKQLMDNFKSPKRTFTRHHAVDGFVANRQPTGRRPVSDNLRTQNGGPIDSFTRRDGFAATAQPPLLPSHDTKAPIPDPTQKKLRKHAKPRRRGLKRVLKVFMVLVLVGVFAAGGLAGYGYLKARKVFSGSASGAAALEKNVDPVKLKGEGDGRINVLLLGVGGEGHEGAYLTDTIIIASIDPVQNEAALLSIPRDLWVKKEGSSACSETSGDSNCKINAVFSNARDASLAKSKDKDAATKAGAQAAQQVLSKVLGIPMDYYVVVDFNGFQKAIDTVGGITINVSADLAVSETLWNPVKARQFVLDVKPGTQNFDGEKALFFARSRKTSARGDFDRAERQKAVIVALKEKVQSAGTYANPVKVTQLLSTFGDHVRTDLSINEVMRLYDIGKSITPDKVASIGLADRGNIMVVGDSINGLSVQVPKAGTFDYSEIQNFVRNQLKDAFIKKENASLMVLNGTATEGLASKKATELRSFGYTVSATGNGPTKDVVKTVIVDMTNGVKKYTKNYLEKRFGVTATTALPDPSINANGADFVILLGTDVVVSTTP